MSGALQSRMGVVQVENLPYGLWSEVPERSRATKEDIWAEPWARGNRYWAIGRENRLYATPKCPAATLLSYASEKCLPCSLTPHDGEVFCRSHGGDAPSLPLPSTFAGVPCLICGMAVKVSRGLRPCGRCQKEMEHFAAIFGPKET